MTDTLPLMTPPMATDTDHGSSLLIMPRTCTELPLLAKAVKFEIDGGKDIAAEIVGVVGNVCVNSIEDCEAEHIYLPEKQNALRMANLLVRTEGDPMALARAVRHAAYVEAPGVPVDDPQTLEERTGYLTDGPRRAMWLLGIFAGLALSLPWGLDLPAGYRDVPASPPGVPRAYPARRA